MQCVWNQVVERFVDARDIDDNTGQWRHNTYESRQSVRYRTIGGNEVALNLGGFFEGAKSRQLLPGEIWITATEVPVSRRLAVNRTL